MSESSEITGTPHFITHVYILDQDNGLVAMSALDPSQSSVAQLELIIPEGVSQLTAYSFCNLHGLWEGPAVSVFQGTAAKTCRVSAGADTAWTSVIADINVQQGWPPHNRSAAYNEPHGAKLIP